MRIRRSAVVVGSLACAVLLAMGGGAAAAQSTPTALLRVANMSPDAPSVTLLMDEQAVVAGLPFRAASPYSQQASGMRGIRLNVAGRAQNPAITTSLPLDGGQAVTLVAVGRADEMSLLPLLDDNSPPPPGKAKVRFVHTVPDAPTVDIAVQGGSILFPRVGFRSVAGYAVVDPGTYSLDVRLSGTDRIAFTVPNLGIQPGTIVTIFASGLASDNSIRVVPVSYGDVGEAQVPAALAHAGRGGALAADQTLSSWMGVVAIVLFALVASPLVARRRNVEATATGRRFQPPVRDR